MHSDQPVSKTGMREVVIAFAVALATLLLQLVQTRIFGVVYWNHLVYFIVSIALLGFGISGTWLTFADNPFWRKRLSLENAAILFVITALFSTLVAPRFGINLGSVFRSTQQVRLFATYAFAVMPYFFGGWILGSIFRDHAQRIHTLYFADLIGAGLGCVLYVVLMQPIGAVNLVVMACLFVLIPIVFRKESSKVVLSAGVACLVVLGLVSINSRSLSDKIVPELSKAFNALFAQLEEGEERIHEYSEWNTISRIDVAGSTQNPDFHGVFIDGDAWTGVVKLPEGGATPFDFEVDQMNFHKLPFILYKDYENSLVIGSGGGVDVLHALKAGAKNVDAVEINPTTYHLGLDEYAEENGGLFNLPQVNAYNEEGRSFVRRSDTKYDVIMIHGIDTFAALNAGAYVLSENYLYTVDGMKDYLLHLSEGGALCITRWDYAPEAMRLFTVALEALYELGVENPEQCIVAEQMEWMTVLVRLKPFSAEELDKLRTVSARTQGKIIFPIGDMDPAEFGNEAVRFDRYAKARAEGTHGQFLSEFRWNVAPVWDDSPFFFNYDKLSNIGAVRHEQDAPDLIRGHWASLTLYILLGLTAVAVALFMVLPLVRRGNVEIVSFKSWLMFFSCLGTGYMFIEIALMQRFALLLGHPSRSIALVLGTLLIATGVGSYIRDKFRPSMTVSLGALVALILVAAWVYPSIIVLVLGESLPVRSLVTIALIAPLGILMGMPFPSGIQCISEENANAIPWMWSINGGTSVLGSIVAIILAINFGFSAVFYLAAAGYLIALFLFNKASAKA